MKRSIIALLFAVVTICSLGACHKKDDAKPSKTFVLVAGAWQGAYVWQYVKADLEKSGQKVVVVELPAHGDDNTAIAGLSIDVYSNKVIDAINAAGGKVILVGHSMAGVVVTATAEKIPNQIEKLVYIGAFLPANGQSLLDLAGTDTFSLLGPALIPSADQSTLDVKADSRINIFCQDGSDEVKNLMLSKFRVEPAFPFTNKVALTDANYGRVDKYYIHTLQDHAISMSLQSRMVTAAHITKEYSVNTGHSPFLSKPDDVAAILLSLVN